VGDKKRSLPYKRWGSNDLEICCLSNDPDEKYKFSTLGAVSASSHLERKMQKNRFSQNNSITVHYMRKMFK
jgi:hypothetical protein